MEIDGFKIEGIANIPSLSMNVGKISALIAPNGYGKSNVLRATIRKEAFTLNGYGQSVPSINGFDN